jgi:catechol 2,3-dioxygenase-like lactoylglutathione lyase family enzyme
MTVGAVTIAAARPRELAHFYARLLGWEVSAEEPARPGHPPDDGWAQVSPGDVGRGPTLNFEFDEHYQRPVWPSVDGEQTASQHLDIGVADLDAAVSWAVEQGAVLADHQPQDGVRVLLDPDGHPFCLC